MAKQCPFSIFWAASVTPSSMRRAMKGCWVGVGSVDGGATSEDRWWEVRILFEMLGADGLPGWYQSQRPQAQGCWQYPAAVFVASPVPFPLPQSLAVLAACEALWDLEAALADQPLDPLISTSALVRRRGGRAVEEPSGVGGRDEVDGAVASAETSSCGFSGVEVGVWASTSSSEFLSVSSGSEALIRMLLGVGAPAYCSHSDTWAFPHHQAALRGWSPRQARAPPALDRWGALPAARVGLGAEEVRERFFSDLSRISTATGNRSLGGTR